MKCPTGKPLTIGLVARRAGVGVETVRFYERQGLIEEPPRRRSGHREYDDEVVARLTESDQEQLLAAFEKVESEEIGQATHDLWLTIADELADRLGVPRARSQPAHVLEGEHGR